MSALHGQPRGFPKKKKKKKKKTTYPWSLRWLGLAKLQVDDWGWTQELRKKIPVIES